MFSIGLSEPLDSAPPGLVRHSIVWAAGYDGDNAMGLHQGHPVCGVILRLLERARFVGTWLTFRECALLRDFERKVQPLLAQQVQIDDRPRWSELAGYAALGMRLRDIFRAATAAEIAG